MDVLYYNGAHSVIFGNKHSWTDWHLVPLSKPVVSPPELVENFVDIPGANGQLDLTEVINGFPTYKNRSGEFAFLIDPDYGYLDDVYPGIANTIHGQRMQIILTDDPDWYYEGRVKIGSAEASREYSAISFSCTLDPFKLTVEPIPGFANIVVNGTTTISLSNISGEDYCWHCPMRQIPLITSTGSVTAGLTSVDGTTSATLVAGTYRYPALVFGPGENTLTLTGNGTVTVVIRGGSL